MVDDSHMTRPSNQAEGSALARHNDQTKALPPGWPEVIVTRVWIGREDGYWFALSEDFDVVGQGSSPALAIREMAEMVSDYLTGCAREGIPFEQVRRRVPLKERVKLHARAIISTVKRPLSQEREVSERNYLVPGFC